MHLEDIKVKVEGILISVKQEVKKDNINNYPLPYTTYSFLRASGIGKTIEDYIRVPEMTYASDSGIKKGDQITIERTRDRRENDIIRIEISHYVDRRCFPDFWNKVKVKDVKHEYEWPLEDQNL